MSKLTKFVKANKQVQKIVVNSQLINFPHVPEQTSGTVQPEHSMKDSGYNIPPNRIYRPYHFRYSR